MLVAEHPMPWGQCPLDTVAIYRLLPVRQDCRLDFDLQVTCNHACLQRSTMIMASLKAAARLVSTAHQLAVLASGVAPVECIRRQCHWQPAEQAAADTNEHWP